MVWSRGPSDDYDRWARVTRDPGLSWEFMEPVVKSVRFRKGSGPRAI